MPTTNINIRTDSDIKMRAQEIFSALGIDMTTAVNLFLRQTIDKVQAVNKLLGYKEINIVPPPMLLGGSE